LKEDDRRERNRSASVRYKDANIESMGKWLKKRKRVIGGDGRKGKERGVRNFAFGGVKTTRLPEEKNRKVAEEGMREGGIEERGLSRGEMEEMMGGLMEKMECRMLEGMNKIKKRVEEMREFTREVKER